VRIEHCRLAAPRSYGIYIKSRIGRAGIIEDISGEDLDIQEGSFLRVNLVGAGNSNTADDPVEGPAGYPEGRDFRFSNIRLNGSTVADVSQISPEKPLEGLTLENITGACTKGITMQHVNKATLRDIRLTGLTGPLLSTNSVNGKGLEEAVPYTAPARR
jgi:hypothetical protein